MELLQIEGLLRSPPPPPPPPRCLTSRLPYFPVPPQRSAGATLSSSFHRRPASARLSSAEFVDSKRGVAEKRQVEGEAKQRVNLETHDATRKIVDDDVKVGDKKFHELDGVVGVEVEDSEEEEEEEDYWAGYGVVDAAALDDTAEIEI